MMVAINLVILIVVPAQTTLPERIGTARIKIKNGIKIILNIVNLLGKFMFNLQLINNYW